MSAKKSLIEQLVRPVVEGLGYECWGVEFHSQGRHSVLRVFIESRKEGESGGSAEQSQAESESGIELKDCEVVSRQLGGVLDVEEPISNDYTLEVSSPGLDRPLYELSHYQRFVGSQVALKLRMPYENQRKFSGLLKGIEGNDIVLVVADNEYLFPLEGIEKANVIPQFD